MTSSNKSGLSGAVYTVIVSTRGSYTCTLKWVRSLVSHTCAPSRATRRQQHTLGQQAMQTAASYPAQEKNEPPKNDRESPKRKAAIVNACALAMIHVCTVAIICACVMAVYYRCSTCIYCGGSTCMYYGHSRCIYYSQGTFIMWPQRNKQVLGATSHPTL